MNQGRTILAQLISFLPKYEFDKCVNKYKGNYKVRSFSCWEQFIVMIFAQLTHRESLRDIETCLAAVQNKLYHSGVKSEVARSTLADANESRDWRIYGDFAQLLIKQARELYADDPGFLPELDNMVYALDSTTIDLCLALFPWARFRNQKGAVKLHTLLDIKGSIPTVIEITDGLVHDVNILDILLIEPGAFYVMDKGYVDYQRLHRMHSTSAFFITRAKSNMAFRRVYSHPHPADATAIRCDQTIVLTGTKARKDYPEKLRRVKYYDEVNNKTFVFLTNNFQVPAIVVAQLYKERWRVELFFKWIKQHLRIKSFYGTTRNAVFTQTWIAICAYLIVVIIKKKLRVNYSPYTILQVISIGVFEKTPLRQALTNQGCTNNSPPESNQLTIFDL